MTAPSYTTDLATIDDATAVGSWDESSNGSWDDGSGCDDDTDYYISDQSAGGTPQCISQQCSIGAGKSGVATNIADYGSGITWTSGDCVFVWQFFAFGEALESYANGGQRVIVGTGLGDFKSWDTGGNDRSPNPYGGWYNAVVDPAETADDTVGTPGTAHRYFGSAVALTTGIAKGNPFGNDIIRYGRGDIQVEYGEAADYATFAGMAAANDATAARWGLFQEVSGGYLWKGRMLLGTSTNAIDMRDATGTSITIDDTPKVSSSFNAIVIDNASSNIEWTGHRIFALGTQSPGTITVSAAATLKLLRCTFEGMGDLSFSGANTASYFNGCFFKGCGEVTVGTTVLDFSESSFLTPTVNAATTTGDAAFVWGSTTNPGTGGDMDDMSFSKGANAHHAIAFDNATASTYTINGCTFTDFNASDANNDSTFYVAATTGTVTINCSGCTGNLSYKSAGATVSIVEDPVDVTAYAVNIEGDAVVTTPKVFLEAADATGPFPYRETVTIVNSGTTATVTHTAHGMASNDKVHIQLPAGVAQTHWQNGGVFSITYISTSSYSYTLPSAPGSSPTGTIKATFAALAGSVDGTGKITANRVYSSDQPVRGWIRLTPQYKTAPLSGTVDSTDGLTLTGVLIDD